LTTASLDEVRASTASLFGESSDDDGLTQELIDEFERSFIDAGETEGVSLVDATGSVVSVGEGIAGAEAATSTLSYVYYGNHPAQIGTCLYWKTNGVGGPCGTAFVGRACGWRTASRTQVASCSGGYAGYRLTFN
jgi:hypothetical protein